MYKVSAKVFFATVEALKELSDDFDNYDTEIMNDLLKQMQEEDIQKLQMAKPTIYKRGEFNLSNEFVNLIGELNER